MKHTVILENPPCNAPSQAVPDGAITGNGDISVVWGGTSSKHKIYISKNEIYKGKGGKAILINANTVGGFELKIPCFKFKPYHVEQRMDEAELFGKFSNDETSVEIRIIACATQNIVLVELRSKGKPVEFTASPWIMEGNGVRIGLGKQNQVKWLQRRLDSPESAHTGAVIAMKTLDPFVSGDETVYRYALSVVTDLDSEAYKAQAIDTALSVDRERFERLYACHKPEWRDFWSNAAMELYDRELELNWYAGRYFLACYGGADLAAADMAPEDSEICSVFLRAIKSGAEPDEIVAGLKNYYRRFQYQNLMFNISGSALTNAVVTTLTINEMLLRSQAGELALFPVWNVSRRVNFTNLPAEGGFIVSACMEDGIFRHGRVICENGGDLKLVLPQSSELLKISVNGRELKTENNAVTVETQPGDTLYIVARSSAGTRV